MTPLVSGSQQQVAKVVVANVYAGGTTVELEVAASTTIGSLKARLADSFAERPAPSEQRLIYCGKICKDESSLRDVLRSMDAPQTLHMVLCRGPRRQGSDDAQRAPIRPQSRPTHALPVEVLDAIGRVREMHLAAASVYAEAIREGRWTTHTPSVLDEAAANAGVRVLSQQRFATVLGQAATHSVTPREPRSLATAFSRLVAAIRGHAVLGALDLRLALKLIVLVALLCHDGDTKRLAVLSALALTAFCFQTGLASMAWNALTTRLEAFQPTDDISRSVHQAVAAGRIPPRSSHRLFNPFVEAFVFLATFALSLVPAWRTAAVPPNQERPHAD